MLRKWKFETTSMFLHVFAMVCMLCDHLWGTIVPGNDWLTCIGRLAYPIFAFLIVEGYYHTKDYKKYVKRLFLCALISEIPFNLAMSGSWIYPYHQNVIWTFLIGLGCMHCMEKVRDRVLWKKVLVGMISVFTGIMLGLLTMVDYYHTGVLMVLVFYFFRERNLLGYVGQFAGLWYINTELLGGFGYELNIIGQTFFVHRQSLALLALIPIWLYHGEQGLYNKTIRNVYYWFYPVHLLILGLLAIKL